MNELMLGALLQSQQRQTDQMQESARQQAAERAMFEQQSRIRSTQGLAIRRPMGYAPMQLVPPPPSKDKFQSYMLNVIDKCIKMHKEAFDYPPERIELGKFLQKRLRPWMDEKLVQMLRKSSDFRLVERLQHSDVVTCDLETYTENRYFLKGMLVEEHPEETWIDIR